ncbi:MAG: hypothetical protein HQK54_13410, partial [Oligoflexales bacterium]|nr:hypothetical protein [Oligoflexales bacterium]
TRNTDSSLSSLGNYSEGQTVEMNSCEGPYDVAIDPARIIHFENGVKNTEEIVKAIEKSLTSIPEGIQGQFVFYGGKIIIKKDVSKDCSSKQGDSYGCFVVSTATSGASLYFPASSKSISHSLVRGIGYLVGSYLVKVRDTGKNNIVVDDTMSKAFDEKKEAIAKAFALDMGEKAGSIDISADDVFANAFDSYYCSEKTRKELVGKDAKFARTYEAFAPIVKEIGERNRNYVDFVKNADIKSGQGASSGTEGQGSKKAALALYTVGVVPAYGNPSMYSPTGGVLIQPSYYSGYPTGGLIYSTMNNFGYPGTYMPGGYPMYGTPYTGGVASLYTANAYNPAYMSGRMVASPYGYNYPYYSNQYYNNGWSPWGNNLYRNNLYLNTPYGAGYSMYNPIGFNNYFGYRWGW